MRFGLIEDLLTYVRTICSFDVKRGFGTTWNTTRTYNSEIVMNFTKELFYKTKVSYYFDAWLG